MPHGARADSQSLQDEQVKTGQPGTQKQSVPSKIVDRKESSTPKEHMKAWKEEITSMVSFNLNPCF